MDYFNNNMKCLQMNKKNLYERLIKSDETENAILIETAETRDEERTIYIDKEGTYYRLNSSYHPLAEAACWAEQFKFDSIQLIIAMFGLGNGIFAREILKRFHSDFSFIIYEPSKEIFLHVMENYDLTDLLENQKIDIIVEGVNDLAYEEALNKYVDWTNMNSLQTLCHPHYNNMFRDSYYFFQDKIKSHKTTQLVNQNTAAFLGKAITKNSIYNIKHLAKSNVISDFYKVFPDEVPAIIVGAGPSLDNNIEELRNAKGKAVIFATDTALKFLLWRNIKPDFVVTLEANKSMWHFNENPAKMVDLLYSIESNPSILDYHEGRKILYNAGNFMEIYCRRNNIEMFDYSSGGSVSTACFSLCANLGFRKIILIGQDLSFKGDVTHAHGFKINNNTGEKTLFVEGNNGELIKTRYDWYSYIQWFNHAIAISYENGIEVINATEGGAKLEKAKLMTFSNAIKEYCNLEIDINEIKQIIYQKKKTENKGLLLKYINESIKDTEIIRKYAIEAVDICNKLLNAAKLNELDFYSNQALVKKISRINNKIQDKAVYNLIDDYILEITTSQLGEINSVSDNEKDSQIDVYKRSSIVYTAIRDASKDIKKLLENTVKDLQ